MRVCVTGSEGFIGSHFADLLAAEGHDILRVDKRLGIDFRHVRFSSELEGCDWVAHFAAHADVRGGWDHPYQDVVENTVATNHLLTAMRRAGCHRILFASSSAAVRPKSLYGASKAACEALIEAYCRGQGFTGIVGRWVLVFGERYHHGHVVDFVARLQANPDRLELLGDSQKTGIYVKDLCRGLYKAMGDAEGFTVRHYGTGAFRISESARWIGRRMGLNPQIIIGNGGWVDNTMLYSEAGTPAPTLTVKESIERTVDYLCA